MTQYGKPKQVSHCTARLHIDISEHTTVDQNAAVSVRVNDALETQKTLIHS